jgi:hypothetical protein
MREPYPGSVDAVEQGCTCPTTKNENGAGIHINRQHFYWVGSKCPLHGIEANRLT